MKTGIGRVSIVIGSWGSYNECNERALGSRWLDLSEYTDWNHRLLVSENETEKILEQYVPVSDALVDSYTGEVVRQEEAEPDLMALIARSFDEAYISDLYERLEYHIDIC